MEIKCCRDHHKYQKKRNIKFVLISKAKMPDDNESDYDNEYLDNMMDDAKDDAIAAAISIAGPPIIDAVKRIYEFLTG